jgi:hypothetical protein
MRTSVRSILTNASNAIFITNLKTVYNVHLQLNIFDPRDHHQVGFYERETSIFKIPKNAFSDHYQVLRVTRDMVIIFY